jgi:signal transduction histidine kinase
MKFYTLFIVFFITTIVFGQSTTPEKKAFDDYEAKCNRLFGKNQLDSCEFYIEKINDLFPKIKDSSYFYKKELLEGTILTSRSKYELAMKKLLKATDFFSFQKDSSNYIRGRYKIGICYYYVNRREDVKRIMLEIINYKNYVTEKMLANAYSNIGAIDIELGMINKKSELINNATSYLKKAISLNKKNNKFGRLSGNYSLLAESYNQLKEKDKALILLDSAIYYSKIGNDKSNEAFALIKKVNILTTQKQFEKALKLIDNAVGIYQNIDHIPTLIYAYVEKKKLLVAMKSYEEANAISDSIYGLSIKNYDQRFADGISEMKVKYNTAEKERKILVQRADIAEKELMIQKRNYQIYGIIAFAVLIIFLAILLFKQQQHKNLQLHKENKLKVALQKIETQNKLQEQRLRISRDLHDNIGAQLSFIISSVDNLKFASKNIDEAFKDKLSYISGFTSTTISQLRDTIWAMNKNEISLTDLQSRILSFIEKAKIADNNIKITFENNIESDISFTSIKGMNIYRVVQESLNNAIKYANATKIAISLTEDENSMKLTVKDNGKGFDIKTVKKGNGLYNMQDRMDEIDGEIIIDSKIKKGTSIIVICKKGVTNQV